MAVRLIVFILFSSAGLEFLVVCFVVVVVVVVVVSF